MVTSQLLRIPLLKLTIGTEESWVSFFGSYLGSIISGFITLIVFIETLNYYRNKDRMDNLIREDQNRLSIIPYIQARQVIKNKGDLFFNIYIGKIRNKESYVECISYFEIENIGLGTVTNLEFNSSEEVDFNVTGVNGISLKVGQSHNVELTMDIPAKEGIHMVSCKIEYCDLLGNQYEQEIILGAQVDKNTSSNNLQIIEVTPPIYYSDK